MSEWHEVSLSEVAPYWTGKVESQDLNEENFISADNMLPDKGGIVNSVYTPTAGKSTSFKPQDTLISNIRPYFKKIWFANKVGGCSNDVIVFRSTAVIDPRFMYYCLSNDNFFDYMMSGANGTKMPRGNKQSIPKYKINLPPLPAQQKIAKILSNHDDLIENNLKRIKLLEESARLTYEEWFLRFRIDGKKLEIDPATGLPFGWRKRKLTDVIKLNPLTKTEKGVEHPFIPMGSLSETNMVITDIEKRIPKGGAKFKNLDTLLARITPCLENGKTGFVQCLKDGEIATGSTEFIVMRATEVISPYYIYSLARTDGFREIAIQSMSGSDGRQRVKVKVFEKILLNIPDNEILHKYHLNMKAVFEEVQVLINQNQLLKEARDILLPRLMTNVIDTDDMDIAV